MNESRTFKIYKVNAGGSDSTALPPPFKDQNVVAHPLIQATPAPSGLS
jgi:hypothetical protein